jgi:hypothetical protein
MGKSTISMAIFNSYFDITRGYIVIPINQVVFQCISYISWHGQAAGSSAITTLCDYANRQWAGQAAGRKRMRELSWSEKMTVTQVTPIGSMG